MAVNPAGAVAAYSNTARVLPTPAAGIGPSLEPTFTHLVENAAQEAVAVGKGAESQAVQQLNGKGELADLVTAVSNAEVTLQSVVAVRDRVVSAYQDILKMPI